MHRGVHSAQRHIESLKNPFEELLHYISMGKPRLALKKIKIICMAFNQDVILLHSCSFIFTMGRIKLFPYKNYSLFFFFFAFRVSDF